MNPGYKEDMMSPPHDQDALSCVSALINRQFDPGNPPEGGVIEIPLSTSVSGNTISIVGERQCLAREESRRNALQIHLGRYVWRERQVREP